MKPPAPGPGAAAAAPRGGKITREVVLAAALDIVDRDGADTLSMRRLAHALDRDPMILYRYAANKAAAGGGGVAQLLGDIPPPGTPLHRERDVITAGEPRQPSPQVHPVSRGDLATLDLPGHAVEIVEGQLLPVDIQPAYDGQRDLLKLLRGRTPPCEMPTRSSLTRV